MHKKGFYELFLKRPMDFVLSLIAIIVLSPVLIAVAFLVKIKLGSPILFKQERPGKDEKKFTMYKFRTMTDEKDKDGNLLPSKDRITRFGKVLRSLSIDELPGLLNIIKGDLSLVGPRPLLVDYLQYYEPHERVRHSVRPGLTGLAQINGRNAISWEQKFEYDIKYAMNINFFIDIKIIIKTILKVIKRENINPHEKKISIRLDEVRKNDNNSI